MYTRITPAKNGKGSIEYALGIDGKGHNGHEFRNLLIGTVNMFDDNVMSYADQMAMYWCKASDQHEIQTRRIIAAPSSVEGSTNDPNDVLRLMETCQEFIQTHYPDRQALICLQDDGASGYLHAHMIVNDCDMISGKGCSSEQQKYWFVQKHFDEIAEKYYGELDHGENKTCNRKSQFQRAVSEGKTDKLSWMDDLQDGVLNAMQVAVNWQDFHDRLEDVGVSAVYHENKSGNSYITYELTDCDQYKDEDGNLPGKRKWLRSKHHKLFKGTEYETLESLEAVLKQNHNEIMAQYGLVGVDEPEYEVEEPEDSDDIPVETTEDTTPKPLYSNLFELSAAIADQELDMSDISDEELSEIDIEPILDEFDDLAVEQQDEMSDEKKKILFRNNAYIQAVYEEGLRLSEQLDADDIKNKIKNMLNENKEE